MTDKQTIFIERYLMHFNASRAALEAGYSEDTAYSIGSENLKKPEIRQAIDSRLIAIFQETNIELKATVLKCLQNIAYSDIKNYVNIVKKEKDGKKYTSLDFEDTTDIDTYAIKSIKQNTQGGISVELYDKTKGLELLGKYLAMFTERVEHSGNIDVKNTTFVIENEG
jgi:phage terminase small subunit